MEYKKIILYGIVGLIILLLILINFGIINFNSQKNSGNGNINYENMPQECRKPDGQDLNSWKEHLSHHQNTLYCLDYYN